MGENIRKTEICNNCTPLIIERILKQENNGVPAFKKITEFTECNECFVDDYLSKYTTETMTNIRINTLHNFCNHHLHPF